MDPRANRLLKKADAFRGPLRFQDRVMALTSRFFFISQSRVFTEPLRKIHLGVEDRHDTQVAVLELLEIDPVLLAPDEEEPNKVWVWNSLPEETLLGRRFDAAKQVRHIGIMQRSKSDT